MRTLIAPILLLAVAACGEVASFADATEGPDIDGSAIDADTKPDALATGDVTVTATHACCTTTGPAAGVDVIVVAPDGTVGDTVQTGGDGKATVAVTAGDSITTILHEGTEHYLSTHLGVEPGDELRVGGDYRPSVARGTMNVSWPAYGGANYYYVFSPCGTNYVGGTPPATTTAVTFRDDCGLETFDIVVVAYGTSGVSGWQIRPGNTFSNGGAIAVGALQGTGTFGVSLSGIPPEVTYYSASASGRLTGGGEIYGGSYGLAPVNGTVNGTFPWTTAAAGTVVRTSMNRPNFLSQRSRELLPPTATTYNRTSVEPLPWLDDNFIANFAARAVTWIQDGEQPYDGAAVFLEYYVASGYYRWMIVAPPGVTNLRVPTLPTAFAAHDLQGQPGYYSGATLFDRGDVEDYAGFRGVPIWELQCPGCGSQDAAAPAVRWSGSAF